ncbi:hypothetical protein EXM60_14515 [Clostridium botulinum]|nr:hypothetical protein [Clostridium botulinum]NFA17669.1 hypothetical protein [Clostridium botulinum]NFA54313.1 hypothetical protein [Clostridium botulinum]NFA67871.1 hypothetical protein [Clostridium botulinum]NFE17005.1 hypothetical protein [Clostridium botulinum]
MDKFKYMTKNRKLKLEEYDNKGNLVDIREFSDNDLFSFISIKIRNNDSLGIARKKDLECFSKEELELINDIMYYLFITGDHSFSWFTNKETKIFQRIFAESTKEELKFALELTNYDQYAFNINLKSKYAFMKFNFSEALEFIKSRDGIYYAVNNNGERAYDFVDKPTKKQVKYQRVKNGRRTVFFSFKDWKEYIVNEEELI